MQYDLPGVLDGAPHGSAVNGSLWSLQYEVLCYLGALLFGLAGAVQSRRVTALLTLAYLAAYATWLIEPFHLPKKYILDLFFEVSPYFVLGMLAYIFQRAIPLSLGILLGLAATTTLARLSLGNGEAFRPFLIATVAYAVLYIAAAPITPLRRLSERTDISYGVYIYAFPVQQAFAWGAPPMTPLANILLSLPFIVAFAYLSAIFVEQPARHLGSLRLRWG